MTVRFPSAQGEPPPRAAHRPGKITRRLIRYRPPSFSGKAHTLPHAWLTRRQMPLSAQRTMISLAPPFHAENRRGVERIALGTITALAGAHLLTLIASRLLHQRTVPAAPSRSWARSPAKTQATKRILRKIFLSGASHSPVPTERRRPRNSRAGLALCRRNQPP